MKSLVKEGLILLFGNNESPANYPANCYYPFRQDSSFLYYFGLDRAGLVGVIDIDEDTETLVGDDIDIEDIVWFGSVDSVSDMAASTGIANTAPMRQLQAICNNALRNHRPIHFLPPYRHDKDTNIQPPRHTPKPAERSRLARTDKGRGENALGERATGD